jgi:hypothetical protein
MAASRGEWRIGRAAGPMFRQAGYRVLRSEQLVVGSVSEALVLIRRALAR